MVFFNVRQGRSATTSVIQSCPQQYTEQMSKGYWLVGGIFMNIIFRFKTNYQLPLRWRRRGVGVGYEPTNARKVEFQASSVVGG